MQKARLIVAALIMSLLVSVAGGALAQEEGTIVDIAAGDENFSTLVSLVEAAGLVETLSGEGPFTVFAPTNDAFAALPEAVVTYLGENPDLLTAVLTYHVVGAEVTSDMIEPGEVATVEGGTVVLATDDMGVTVDGVNVVIADVAASNGVIHAVDGVLIPDVMLPEVDPLDFADGSINSAGSSTVFPLAERMGEVWSDAGGVAPAIDSIGSGGGFERFCVAGESDISNASRAIRDTEIESCAEIGRLPISIGR
ncbi:MAG: fasciclin domain-containing protein, partial [Chloroflexota bacterium]